MLYFVIKFDVLAQETKAQCDITHSREYSPSVHIGSLSNSEEIRKFIMYWIRLGALTTGPC
jgi:hypothetical protein